VEWRLSKTARFAMVFGVGLVRCLQQKNPDKNGFRAFAHFDIPTAEGGLELEKTSGALKLRLTLRAVFHHKCCKEGCTAVLALQKCFF
jgi:hypothetical protein